MSENDKRRKNKKNKRKKEDRSAQLSKDHVAQDVEELETEDQSLEKNQEETWTKRDHADDDSDAEEQQPKRKKKKKQPVFTDTENKKGAKSIRQMKREKFAARQVQAQAVAKDHLKTECLNYISQWKYDKKNWKFMKAKQVWLFKNKFSSQLVPDASWPQLLEYFESAQGNIRKLLLDDAIKVIKQLDEWTESQSKENNENDEAELTKPGDNVFKRARDLIQCLEE